MNFDELVEAAIYQLLNVPCDDDDEETGIDMQDRRKKILAKLDDYTAE